MRLQASRVTVVGLTALLLVGCGTVDIASRHTGPAPKCEVHGVTMTPELITMSPGEVVYVHEYWKPAHEQFPITEFGYIRESGHTVELPAASGILYAPAAPRLSRVIGRRDRNDVVQGSLGIIARAESARMS